MAGYTRDWCRLPDPKVAAPGLPSRVVRSESRALAFVTNGTVPRHIACPVPKYSWQPTDIDRCFTRPSPARAHGVRELHASDPATGRAGVSKNFRIADRGTDRHHRRRVRSRLAEGLAHAEARSRSHTECRLPVPSPGGRSPLNYFASVQASPFASTSEAHPRATRTVYQTDRAPAGCRHSTVPAVLLRPADTVRRDLKPGSPWPKRGSPIAAL